MTRDEFFERFPFFIDLPERPQCKECWHTASWAVIKGELHLTEYHRPHCSRTKQHCKEHVIESVQCPDEPCA